MICMEIIFELQLAILNRCLTKIARPPGPKTCPEIVFPGRQRNRERGPTGRMGKPGEEMNPEDTPGRGVN